MLELLDNVVFFPKSLDDLDGLFPSGKEYSIFACRASSVVYAKYPYAYVYEAETGNRLFSTTKFFRKILSTLNIASALEGSDGILTYQAYPWCDDLRNLGYRVCAVSHLLYSALHNKFKQREMLTNGARAVFPTAHSLLEQHFSQKENRFKTEVTFFNPEQYEIFAKQHPHGFVVANSSSDGGSNVFKVQDAETYKKITPLLSSPVVRVESYIQNSLSINQVGVVLENGWIMKYQPSAQLLEVNRDNGRFEYVGSSYELADHGVAIDDPRISAATQITDSVGKGLWGMGYRGVFGCDYLLTGSKAFFIELNPRYQASTRILSIASEKKRELSPHVLHIASFHSSNRLDTVLLKPFSESDAVIHLTDESTPCGYIRVWDSDEPCDRPMVGKVRVESNVHVGYNLLGGHKGT